MDIHINVENFGPIEKAEIDLRPLTVFVGESNTGKTYLAALIYALYQNFRGISQFSWANSVTSHFSFAYRLRDRYSQGKQDEVEQEILELLEKLNTPDRPFKYSDLPERISIQAEFRLTDQEDFPNELIRCFDLESISKLIRFTGNRGDEMNVSLSVHEEDQLCWYFEIQDIGTGPTANVHINPDLILLDANDEMRKTELRETTDIERLFETLSIRRWRTMDSYYLPAARSGIMQSHGVIATALIRRATRIGLDRLEVSTFSGMIGDFLQRISHQYKENEESSKEISHVAEQLEAELLEGKIEVKRSAPEAFPEFLYRPNQSEETLRMSHSSAMVSELAPLVLFLRSIVRQGDLLIIEEPESHLHPGAQTIIAQTFARLVRAGVRVLITTHSNYLIQQIGNLIREGELQKQGESTSESADYLKAEEVGAWWFHKDKPVEELPFDLVEGIEPEDHLDIAEDLYNRSAGLQNRIEQTKGKNAVESE